MPLLAHVGETTAAAARPSAARRLRSGAAHDRPSSDCDRDHFPLCSVRRGMRRPIDAGAKRRCRRCGPASKRSGHERRVLPGRRRLPVGQGVRRHAVSRSTGRRLLAQPRLPPRRSLHGRAHLRVQRGLLLRRSPRNLRAPCQRCRRAPRLSPRPASTRRFELRLVSGRNQLRIPGQPIRRRLLPVRKDCVRICVAMPMNLDLASALATTRPRRLRRKACRF